MEIGFYKLFLQYFQYIPILWKRSIFLVTVNINVLYLQVQGRD